MINVRKTMLPERLAVTAVLEIPFLAAEATALIIHRITETMVNI